MAKKGRKPLEVKRTRQSIFVSDDILAEVKILLADPTRDMKARWGSWSDLVDGLLREWVEKQRRDAAVDEIERKL